jgi:DNA-binding XRE family transcriptional regulator
VTRQPDLFDPPPPARRVPTSQAAARRIRGDPARGQRLRLRQYLEDRAELGATQEEAATALRMGRPTMCAWMWELEQSGLAVKTARTRPTTAGRAAIVYVYRRVAP